MQRRDRNERIAVVWEGSSRGEAEKRTNVGESGIAEISLNPVRVMSKERERKRWMGELDPVLGEIETSGGGVRRMDGVRISHRMRKHGRKTKNVDG